MTLNRELELVESMDKLSEIIRKFQKQLLSGRFKGIYSKTALLYRINHKNKGISISELSRILDVNKSTVSVAINQLIDLNIVIKKQSKNDKRFYYLELTPKGEDIIIKHMQVHKDTIKKILDILNQEEVDNFIKIINKIQNLE